MKSFVRPRYSRPVVFVTWFPLEYDGEIFTRYCTYGSRFTWQYLKCLIFGHRLVYRDVSVSPGKVEGIRNAECCGRTYYP